MRKRTAAATGLTRFTVPVKAWMQRFAFGLLLAIALGFLLVGRIDVAVIERTRAAVIDAVSPVLSALASPVEAARTVIRGVAEIAYLREDNLRLREENARLMKWQEMARRYEYENASLRRLTQITADPTIGFISARVVGDASGSYVRTVLLNAGGKDGVRRGQITLTEAGVVGRVVELGQQSARVLLLDDLNSRIPIMLEGSRYRGILAGDNTAQPRIEFLPGNAQVSPGDRVVTSGDGGLFPPGLPIGVVSSVIDGSIRVQPYVDVSRLELVSILYYDFPKPLADGAAAPTLRPPVR